MDIAKPGTGDSYENTVTPIDEGGVEILDNGNNAGGEVLDFRNSVGGNEGGNSAHVMSLDEGSRNSP